MDIKITHGNPDNFGESLNILVSLVHQCNLDNTGMPIHFDFSNVKFASPLLVCGISALYDQLTAGGIEVQFTFEKNNRLYFETIGFYEGINPYDYSIADLEKKFQSFHSINYFPLTKFPASISNEGSSLREKTLSAIHEIIRTQLILGGNILQAIFYLIDELTQNVSDHSQAKYGRIMANYYPAKRFMDICIVDNGKGLLKSYIENGKYAPKNHSGAIDLALNGKSTKYNDSSRGFGLSTSIKMLVDGLNGKFFLWSGDALFYNDNVSEEIIQMPDNYWQGCFVGMRIPIINHKDFKFYHYVE